MWHAGIAQLGERQTEDLKVPGSIPGHGTLFSRLLFHSRGLSTDFETSLLLWQIDRLQVKVKFKFLSIF